MFLEELQTEVDGVREIKIIALEQMDNYTLFVGCVGLLLGKKSSGVRQLFVDPSYRRRGIGRALIERCCGRAKDHGSETLGLSLAAGNEDAMKFYQRLGFIRAYEYDDGSHVVTKVL